MRLFSRICACGCALLVFSTPLKVLHAEFIDIRWAGTVNVLAGQAALGAPDGIGAPIGQLTTSNFQPATTYSGLASLLGVSQAQISSADVIAFDTQGLAPGQGAGVNNGFESVRIIIGDSQTSAIINHDESLTNFLPGIVATGTLNSTQFNNYFGTNTPFSTSWLLLDIGNIPVDFNSQFFFAEATGGNALGFGGEGSPDLDAIGLLNVSAVPEPSTLLLFAGPVLALGYRRFKRNSHA